MWKYVSGVKAPETKVIKRKVEYYKEYDNTKRTRKYLVEWESGRPWLYNTESGMKCKPCEKYGDKTAMFAVGCTSYKLDSITKHEKAKAHQKCVLVAVAKSKPKSDCKAAQIVRTLNKDLIDKLEKMFRNCHAIVVKNRPLTDYLWQCELDEIKGLNLGEKYRNTETAKVFIDSIAKVELQKVTKLITCNNFLCIIGDGSTDSSIKEQDMWYIRSCHGGKIDVKFIGVANVERANAEGIVAGLKWVVDENLELEWNDFIKKVVAVSCDGASVIVGKKSGVAQILREEQPTIVTLHCMAHRLELSLKDGAKKVQLFEKAISVLAMGLFYFYRNSYLNRSMLRRSYQALKQPDDGNLLIPCKAGGTRWIAHQERAITNLLQSYKFICGHLGQLCETTEQVSSDSKSKAKAFLKLLKSKDIVCLLHLLCDLLVPLRRLSLQLQDRGCMVSKQHSALSATIDVIQKYETSDGPCLKKIIDKDEFHGVKLTYLNMMQFNAARKNIINNIVTALEKRFSEFSSGSENVVYATRIADLQIWPDKWDDLKG